MRRAGHQRAAPAPSQNQFLHCIPPMELIVSDCTVPARRGDGAGHGYANLRLHRRTPAQHVDVDGEDDDQADQDLLPERD